MLSKVVNALNNRYLIAVMVLLFVVAMVRRFAVRAS